MLLPEVAESRPSKKHSNKIKNTWKDRCGCLYIFFRKIARQYFIIFIQLENKKIE